MQRASSLFLTLLLVAARLSPSAAAHLRARAFFLLLLRRARDACQSLTRGGG